MMYKTHIALSVAATSIILGTADPVVLILSAIASQLPDVDTTKSYSGRVLFPLSSYLEKRFAHRSITHSFLALAIFAVVIFPVTFFGYRYYLGLVSGYFWGFFGDVFTKSGV
ncbi:MAG: metal-dependent hydrolase, partial [Waterburya sp.]